MYKPNPEKNVIFSSVGNSWFCLQRVLCMRECVCGGRCRKVWLMFPFLAGTTQEVKTRERKKGMGKCDGFGRDRKLNFQIKIRKEREKRKKIPRSDQNTMPHIYTKVIQGKRKLSSLFSALRGFLQ